MTPGLPSSPMMSERAMNESAPRRMNVDVRACVDDWRPIMEQAKHAIASFEVAPKSLDPAAVAEARAFLEWLVDNHFVFLGYCRYDYGRQGGRETFRPVKGAGLGLLRDPKLNVLAGTTDGHAL